MELCKICHEEEAYSQTLTDGMCLNCYQMVKEDNRQADIEQEHDYYEGRL